MDAAVTYMDARAFVIALAYTQPRILAMFIAIPIFNRQIMPGLLRYSVAAGLGTLAAPTLMPLVSVTDLTALQIVLLVVKEAFVGFVLGYLIAIPFWAFEAVGFFVDNQRGASISATLNPLTGNDTSPLGILFNQAFIVFFFAAGGFMLMLDVLYDSFSLWKVVQWFPTLQPDTMPLMLEQLARIARIGTLLAAPAIVAMFLAEVGLALISRFVPQLDVFFLAMPIKSALAVLVLLLYLPTLFHYGSEQIQEQRTLLPMLEGQWNPSDRATSSEGTR